MYYNYNILISVIILFLNCSFSEIRNEDLNSPAQCYLPPHPSLSYHCLVFGRVEDSRTCGTYVINGTVVRPQCRSPYYYSGTVLTDMLCVDGNWNYIAKCSPECGLVSSTGTPLVVDGEPAKRAEVPWHAGIYMKTEDLYEQICGGSLISNKIVLSAAHCFWSNSESKLLSAENYAVAVGKLNRTWSDDKEYAQRSDVKALYLPTLFQGSTSNYQDDIAVVVVKTPYKFTTFVWPVCVDFDKLFQETQLNVGNTGKVAGWGLTGVIGAPSSVLKVIDLPFVPSETCYQESLVSFRGYITIDKMCAGYKNENKGVCKGDSGGGLAFPEWIRGTQRFFLRGIVSTAPTANVEKCNADFYTTFTRVSSHEVFIKQFWNSIEPCQLKPHPSVEYHCVSFENVESYRPCTVVRPECRSPGYYSATAHRLMTCVKGKWDYIAKCSQEKPCKEESLSSNRHSTPLYSMDNETFNHVPVKRDSAGLLTYFEMHIAIEADTNVEIWLGNKEDTSSAIPHYIDVGSDSNQYTDLKYLWTKVQHIYTPDILSSTEFRTFYIKINDGILEFGQEGDSPLISHYDASFRSVNYFSFKYFTGDHEAKIRYDCPREGSS